MSNIPNDLRYTASHEWIRDNEDGTVTVGITDHAQGLLGDLVFVELPDIDAEYDQGDSIAVAESVKAASDIYSPLTGVVTEVNETLFDAPETINESPYEGGWIYVLKMEDEAMLATLHDAETYAGMIEEEE